MEEVRAREGKEGASGEPVPDISSGGERSIEEKRVWVDERAGRKRRMIYHSRRSKIQFHV